MMCSRPWPSGDLATTISSYKQQTAGSRTNHDPGSHHTTDALESGGTMFSANQSLSGKTVLITGAAGGIGAATARVLHRQGANVVLTDLQQRAVDAVADELGRHRTLPLAVDVTDAEALQAAVAAAVDEFGAIDVVFANA